MENIPEETTIEKEEEGEKFKKIQIEEASDDSNFSEDEE